MTEGWYLFSKIIPPSLQHPPQRVNALNYRVKLEGKNYFNADFQHLK
jgi:hypothetical protein